MGQGDIPAKEEGQKERWSRAAKHWMSLLPLKEKQVSFQM